MDFWIKNGSTYQGVIKAAKDAKRRPPPRFIEIEEMTEVWMGYFIGAFFELCTERPAGMGLTSIPWSSIKAYAEHHNFTGLAYQDFHTIIRAMDGHYMEKKDKQADGNAEAIRQQNAEAGKDSGSKWKQSGSSNRNSR